MKSVSIETLEELYKKIPSFKCIPGCNKCCGPVFFAKCEWDRIKDKREATGLKCPYAGDKGCDIYDQRPLICRLFGTIESLKCPYGKGPAFFLSEIEARHMVKTHFDIMDED